MMSEKLAASGKFKITKFSNKYFDVIISVRGNSNKFEDGSCDKGLVNLDFLS